MLLQVDVACVSPHGSFAGRYLSSHIAADASDRDIYGADISSPATPRPLEEALPAAANAAVALAQLHHHHRLSSEWDSDAVCCLFQGSEISSDTH